MDTNCTLNLIGISEAPCDCYTEDLNDVTPPAADWYKTSTSGLFLDELEPEGLVSLRVSENNLKCNKTLGTYYKEARAQALKRTTDDVFTVISERYKNKRDTFSGRVGGKAFTKEVNIPGAAIVGGLLSPFPIIDGVFNLSAINLGSKVSRTGLTVSIYQYLPGSLEEPTLVVNIDNCTTVSGRVTTKTLTSPLSLPLEVNGERVQYLFIYNLQPGEQPVNSSTSCGCGKKEALFNEYAVYQGITIGSDADYLSEWKANSTYAFGMSLEGEFTCLGSSIVCRMFSRSASWKKVFAYAVRYLAAAIINERVYKSPDISRFTMVNYDEVKASAYNFRGEYATRITWLMQNSDPSVNDCFKCDTSVMRKQGILS